MIRTLALSGALLFALSGIALAQPDAVTAAAPMDAPLDDAPMDAAASSDPAWASRRSAFALRGAYRAIAEVQQLGGSPYLDAAKTHYRNALERYAKQDAAAGSEAMAATALALASLADRPLAVPRDLPTPPAVSEPGAGERPAMGRPPMGGPPGGREMRGGPPGPGGWGHGERFDAAAVATDAKLAGTSEATELAQKALDADLARTRAAFAGNGDEAMREGRLAGALAMAVRSLAITAHPPAMRARPGGSGWQRRMPASGTSASPTST